MNNKIKSNGILLVSISFALFYLLQGCAANLPAVREFSKSTIAATSFFDDIAEDLPKSCARTAEISFMPSPEDKIEIVNNNVELSTEYRESLSTCDKYNDGVNGIVNVNNVLKGYAEAIGKLASDDVVTFTQEVNALRSSLASVGAFQGEKAEAVVKLAEFLFNAALNGYRQNKLKETIVLAHDDLVEIIEGLTIVTSDYQAELSKETKNVEQIQRILINDRKKPEDHRVFKVSVSEIDEMLFEFQQKLNFIQGKNQAAEDYKNILAKIKKAHEKLKVSSDQLDSQQLVLEIRTYAEELIPLINDIRKAFSS